MKNLLIILALVVFSNCKTKEIVITKTNTVYDTVFKEKTIRISVPTYTTIEVPAECDTITGEIKPFKQQIKSGDVSVTIESKNGLVKASVNIDSIVQVALSDYKRTFKKDVKIEEVTITKYKVPKWAWWLLVYSILLTLYIFRKYIPYLKMLPF